MFTKKRTTFVAFTGASLAALGAATPAMAQQSAKVTDEIIVTAEKREASIQEVPIAVSAFSQDNLNALQISGGPNLQQAIPNVNFSKGNFTGSYNFQIRGIGAQLVAGGGDAGVGIHENDIPLIANNLFDAEFYDVQRVEVLRGPQGTLYGRNATGGVVNIITAKPKNSFEAKAEGTYGSDNQVRLEGMVNIPLGEWGGLRIAGVSNTRDGFVTNVKNGHDIDDRDQKAIRVSFGGDMSPDASFNLMYEHFEEDDTRLRVGKQYCVSDPGPASVGGVATTELERRFLSQGCVAGAVLGSNTVLNSNATLGGLYTNLMAAFGVPVLPGNYNVGATYPKDIRSVYMANDPIYRANTDHYELSFNWNVAPHLKLTSLSSMTQYRITTSEDYNGARPTLNFAAIPGITPGGVFTDPQLGAQTTANAQDASNGRTEYYSQELRLQSSFDGPLNFNVGAFYLKDHKAQSEYFVFFNTSTLFNSVISPTIPNDPGTGASTALANVTLNGRNYYLNRSPTSLETSAVFGELYWDATSKLRITGGLRYTDDKKMQNSLLPALSVSSNTVPGRLPFIPNGTNSVEFKKTTGRLNATYTINDDHMVYANYSRGYKAGGINPPPSFGIQAIFPTFAPEFVDAYEIGSKNSFAGGRVQLNATGFYYDYAGYQVSQIIQRTSLNTNIDAEIYGAELEAVWHVTDDFRLNANVGYLHTEITKGSQIDTIDRTQGNALLAVVKSSSASNCVVSKAALTGLLGAINAGLAPENTASGPTLLGVCANAIPGFNFNPATVVPGATFDGVKANLTGNELPQSPEWTASIAGAYTLHLNDAWNAVLHADYYWQDETWGRIYNKPVFDKIPSRDNLNVSVDLNNDPHQFYVRAFVKNVTDNDDVTGTYLTDDSSGLFTNASLTEPRTYGITVGKKW